MKQSLVTISLLTCLLPAAGWSAPPEGYRLAWHDEFDSLELNLSSPSWQDHFKTWNVRALDGNSDQGFKAADTFTGTSGLTVSDALAANGTWQGPPFLHQVQDGKLIMQTYPNPSPDDFGGLPYLASMISGESLHSQRYGYWEVRFRASYIPSGHHAAIWLLSDQHSWPPEIDMVEIVASFPDRFFANSHGLSDLGASDSQIDDPQGWHIAGFEWTKEHLIWRLNGEIVRQEQATLPPDIRLYFLASFEIGSNWPGLPEPGTEWPGRLEIDYIRIYEMPGAFAD